jgi:pimeloyl-ACP methyl ester carboxylesterase
VSSSRRALTSDGVEVAFEERGDGRPLVLLHGLCEDRESWEPVSRELALGEFRCIAFDFRGHGESGRLGGYEPAGFFADLVAVIEATCDEPPLLVGHSLGGAVATVAAALGMTGHVVSIDQPLRQGSFAQLIHSLAARLKDPSSFPDALMEEKLALGMGLVPEPMFSRLERLARTCDQTLVLDTWAPMLDDDPITLAAMDDATRNIVSSLSSPYLTIHGTPLEPEYERWFRELVPHADLESWSGQGHWLHLIDTPRFVDRLSTFFRAA